MFSVWAVQANLSPFYLSSFTRWQGQKDLEQLVGERGNFSDQKMQSMAGLRVLAVSFNQAN